MGYSWTMIYTFLLALFMLNAPETHPESSWGSDVPSSKGSMFVEISGLRNSDGYLLLALFNGEAGFPDDRVKAFRTFRVKAEKGTMKINISDLPPGNYAFGVVHDENDNQKLDKGLFGIPKEGFCFSRQAMGTAGPPSFQAAAVMVTNSVTVQQVKMKYW